MYLRTVWNCRYCFTRFFIFTFAFLPLTVLAQEDEYPLPPEAEVHEGVPEGKIEGPFEFRSEIYPGTQRKYWLFIPAQYDAAKPACTLVVQDGLNRARGWNLPQVMNNLMHTGEMPVTIGVFVDPGVVPPLTDESQGRFNRSFEYDSLGDRYARFLLEELLPEVSKTYSLSTDPNDRALAGASSGGICAFNAAWERPDEFRRVLSTIGTYVGLRGGNELAARVRKTEPKPIRVFLQDGSSDLNIYAGDWWVANQDMLSALTWAGYDVTNIWGEGGHNSKHAAAIMPDALRWLWRDYPEPIRALPEFAADGKGKRRMDLLIPDAGWEEVSSGHEFAEAPACNASGELFFSDSKAERIFRVSEDNKTRIFADKVGRVTGLGFAPNNELLAVKDGKQIVRFDAEGASTVVLEDTNAKALTTMPGGFYYVDNNSSSVYWSTYTGTSQLALQDRAPISALAPTADHAFLHLINQSQFTVHARITEDRKLDARQEYGFLEMPYTELESRATGVAVDREGRVYVASSIGVQVLDQLGRVHFIIELPSKFPLTGVAFGGAARDTLFVTTRAGVYRRRINATGCTTFQSPTMPPKPNL